MKKCILIFVVLITILSGCRNRKNKSSEIVCTVDKIMVSDFPTKKGFDPILKRRYHSFNIYVSLLIINNTRDTINIPFSNSSINIKDLIDRSLFIGYIKDTKIKFLRFDKKNIIFPNDSIRILLYTTHFKPTVNDSLFICQLKNIRLRYEFDNKTDSTNKYLNKLVINNTKQGIYSQLGNNINPEVAFGLLKMDSNEISKFCGHE